MVEGYLLKSVKWFYQSLTNNKKALWLILFIMFFTYSLYRKETNLKWSEPFRIAVAQALRIPYSEIEERSESMADNSATGSGLFGMFTNPEPVVHRIPLTISADKTVISRILRANDIDDFIFQGESDQQVDVNVINGVIMSVLSQDQQPLQNGHNVTQWSNTLPYTGRYYIRIRPTDSQEKVEYELKASLHKYYPE
jgi:hypothetical protein